MATQEQIRPAVDLENEKRAKLDAILDRMVEIATPHLDAMTDEEEAAFLEKLSKPA